MSVLLPVRDEAPFLEAALSSISAQTFEDFEAIVVDDGSVDGSLEIALAHARRDRRFTVLRQPRLGLVAALERARSASRGRFLARMDGDDVALPDRLADQVAALEGEGLTACGGRVEYFPPERVREGARRYQRWLDGLVTVERAAQDVFVECPLPHPTLVVRRDALAAIGGYRSRGWPEDYDLVLRLWMRGEPFRNVDSVVLRWREYEGRSSRVEEAYSAAAFVRVKVHFLRRTLLRPPRRAVLWGAGPVGKAFARELVRQGVEVDAFVDVDPRKIGRRVYGVPVVSYDDASQFSDAVALGAVAGEAARFRLRALAPEQGRSEGRDFVAAA